MKILKRAGLIFCTVAVLIFAALFLNEKINEYVFLTEYTFSHSEVPEDFDGYKIFMISDLHEAPFSKQIIEHINEQKPDVVVITGDMAQLPDRSIQETQKIGKAITDIPVYAVSGNHDTQGGAYKEIYRALKDSNIIPLDDSSVCLEKGSSGILLLGIKDPMQDVVSDEKIENIRRKIERQFPKGPCFSILLSHRADLYPKIKNTGVDLILSGHLHGGIIRLPFVGGIIGKNPEKPLFPEYEYGMYNEPSAASMIVSGGCDKNPQKKRYFNPPEVVLITLKNEGK